jgi:hypothetical protein
MPVSVAGTRIVLSPLPAAHFGAGATDAAAGIVRGTGCGTAADLIAVHALDDEVLASTPRPATGAGVRAILASTGPVPPSERGRAHGGA